MKRFDKRLAIGAMYGIIIAWAIALVIGLHVEPRGSLAEWSQSLARSVWPHISHWLRSPGRKGWATVVELVGAVVTFAGVWTAWLRAKHGETIATLARRLGMGIWERLAKILGRPRSTILYPSTAHLHAHFLPAASASVGVGLDKTMAVDQQIKRLYQRVNRLSLETIPQLGCQDQGNRQQRDWAPRAGGIASLIDPAGRATYPAEAPGSSTRGSPIVDLRRKINEVHAHATDLASQTVAHIQEQIDYLQHEFDTKQVLDLRWAIYGLLLTVVGIGLSYGT